MKKFISIALVLAMMLTLAACGGNNADATTEAPETTVAPTETVTEAPTEVPATDAPAVDPSSLEGIIASIYEQQAVQFMTGNIPVDLTDTSEDGLWALKAYTGLDSAELITEAVASEAMIGSIPYSLVLVRVADAANAEAVADEMKAGIDTRKWICVEATDLMVAGSGDVVMLIMLEGDAQSFVDAFSTVMGGTDFAK